MGLFGRDGLSKTQLPAYVADALALAPRDRVLAVGLDSSSRGHAVLSHHHLALVSGTGVLVFRRPWHEVSSGAWDPVTGSISVVWADGGRATMLTFGVGHDEIADAFRERVQTSVVTSEQILLADDEGPATAGRVALRKNLATDELLVQVSLSRGVRRADPEVSSVIDQVTAYLWEQVGR